ncbi:MAG TPA: hypothetical protein VMS18_21530 [Candidatus Binatia bacterium]|nr:hypothetical protein [Candidatus Binatia bacterium]
MEALQSRDDGINFQLECKPEGDNFNLVNVGTARPGCPLRAAQLLCSAPSAAVLSDLRGYLHLERPPNSARLRI